uniref:Protein-tyrosine phosphatase n=1 Tax=Angiostrongylus cantonensis TaxID=6313 RepID=A0A0K0DHC9_ANGCA
LVCSYVDCRYDDVICIDSTRVILKERPPDDDYIHANWMIMPDQTKYICTQGPIQETLVDFWQMIFTEKSTVIVMLCAFKEGRNEKCALYHPKTKTECGKFGPYRVFLRETINSIEIHHLACSEWPDHTAPLDPGPIVGMLKMARSLAKGNPITVHCSAGIGRSATFVGIDYAMQKIREDSSTSMVEVLKELRKQRFQSVQGIIQYIFLHICLLEAFADVVQYLSTPQLCTAFRSTQN